MATSEPEDEVTASAADAAAEAARSVLATPVGRRWVLKAGLVVTAGVASGTATSGGFTGAPAAAVEGGARPREVHTLHFALATTRRHHRRSRGEILIGGRQPVPLVRHDARSRRALRSLSGVYRRIDVGRLTHYAPDVDLPADRPLHLRVEAERSGRTAVLAEHVHVPTAAWITLAVTAGSGPGSFASAVGSHHLRRLGLEPADITSPEDVVAVDLLGSTVQTAMAIVMAHPQVSTLDPTSAAATKALLASDSAVDTLGSYIRTMQTERGEDWATVDPVTDRDGSAVQITVGTQAVPLRTMRMITTDATFTENARDALSSGAAAVRDTASLGTVVDAPLEEVPAAATRTWKQRRGALPRPAPYQPGAVRGVEAKVLHPGVRSGIEVVTTGTYAGGAVPVRIYNDFVRWTAVYVQYLGTGNANLSIDPDPTFPDTGYATFLQYLPPVATVLGVPLWGTNSIDVSLTFPEGAHTARLLVCGLGGDLLGGDWRQYFPPDAYPDAVSPTESTVAATFTGLFSIGLTAFCLAADASAAALYPVLVDARAASSWGVVDALQALVSDVTVAGSVAVTLLSGAATYSYLATNGIDDASSVWSLLLPIGELLPRLLFSTSALRQLAAAILEVVAANEVIAALPFIGQVMSVIDVVGDVATLAEISVETLVSPWIVENEVNLTYPATVTVSRDPDSGTWPATARSWQLQAQIDGARTLDPVTGVLDQGGETQSEPLVLDVVAPFGGAAIQWVLVVQDAAGAQVGTGASAKLPNDDPTAPPSSVSFAIREVPVPIGAGTTFLRAATTGHDSTAGGHTWSDAIAVPGTVVASGVQQVEQITISTLSAAGGYVWEEGDRFFLRGLPLAQDGATIALQPAQTEGYSRRPFLLLDPLVLPGAGGNHFLLEPQAAGDGYDVRRLVIDPGASTITWAPASYGRFVLPVSAAALHPSGHIVTVSAASGRLGILRPVAAAAVGGPAPARYAAGTGDQIGLTRSPVAVAVTHTGVVVVLEAEAQRLAAFDLEGNPVRYFTAGGSSDYRSPLVSTGTYLDMAVDGSDHLYVLYHTSDGATVGDYRVDVYEGSGAPLVTGISGVNTARLAVDYWRSIFGANYSALTETTTGDPWVDPRLGVAEPSVSRFDPTTAG